MAVPEAALIEQFLLEEVARKGGKAKLPELCEAVAWRFRLTPQERNTVKAGVNLFDEQVEKAAKALLKKGQLGKPGRGYLGLTGAGNRRIRPVEL